jgi:hypothetical protein
MATGVIYLDIDDEITSAAARVRAVEGRRVAVVLPYGSRVATSRINFRLLGRDALTHEKRLSIIAADAASRSLAASAGLPVFASVAEYEASDEAPKPGATGASAGPETASPKGTRKPRRTAAQKAAEASAAAAAAGAIEGVAVAAAPASTGPEPATSAGVTTDGPTADAGSATDTALTGATTSAVTGATARGASRSRSTGMPHQELATARAPMATPRIEQPDRPAAPPRTSPVTRPEARRPGLTPLAIGGAVLALAVVVGGVGAYLLLPSATVVVTPRDETIGPLRMSISASDTVTEPDVDAGVVPAETLTVDVDAARTFPVTGIRVEETKARGTVRFRNKDFTRSNTVPKGSVVSTQSGIRFRTNSAVTVPRAELVGLQVFPATANVKVTAVEAGTDGNVEPNTILIIPRGEDPLTLDVSNPDATSGGTREEFPQVEQKDIDTAVAQLGADLQAAFAERMTDPSLAPEGSTLFPETGVLGVPEYDVDPASLLDQEIETFDLGASASGTVRAVDTAAVQAVAEQRLAANVEADHQLVEGSSEISVEDAVVSDDRITFPVVATATQIALLDPVAIEAAIRGLRLEDAQRVLGEYGIAELTVWPDWVTTIPTIDARVDVSIGGPVAVETDAPSAAPSGSAP